MLFHVYCRITRKNGCLNTNIVHHSTWTKYIFPSIDNKEMLCYIEEHMKQKRVYSRGDIVKGLVAPC